MLEAAAGTPFGPALPEFGLPPATSMEVLRAPGPCRSVARVSTPAGKFMILLGFEAPLALAFEATLFDLLGENRFPAAKPRRARNGSFLATFRGPSGPISAVCYPWPPGEALAPGAATAPQLMEIGRLLARLHRLGEVHPASVPDPVDWAAQARLLPEGAIRDELGSLLAGKLPGVPIGAGHGGLGPEQALFLGSRCSGILPGGAGCAGPLVLDVATTMARWALGGGEPLPVVRAIAAGYQGLRRLSEDERSAFYAALRCAAAREAAALVAAGKGAKALAPLRALEAVGEAAATSALG